MIHFFKAGNALRFAKFSLLVSVLIIFGGNFSPQGSEHHDGVRISKTKVHSVSWAETNHSGPIKERNSQLKAPLSFAFLSNVFKILFYSKQVTVPERKITVTKTPLYLLVRVLRH